MYFKEKLVIIIDFIFYIFLQYLCKNISEWLTDIYPILPADDRYVLISAV